MKKIFVILSLCVSVSFNAFTQGVNQDEYKDLLQKVINFKNYTGNYSKIDSLQSILDIGNGLAQGLVLDKPSQKILGDKYKITHILGSPDEKGMPADILEFLPNAGIDHIDNIRRIIKAYIQKAYGYNDKDAGTISFFLTIYNAVYRQNISYIKTKFKPSVLAVLTSEKIGLSLSYEDWPGKTQILIPLNRNIKDVDDLARISTKDLVTDATIETSRDTKDKSIDERKDLSNLIDRTTDAEANKIENDKKKIEEDKKNTEADKNSTTTKDSTAIAKTDTKTDTKTDVKTNTDTTKTDTTKNTTPADTKTDAKTADTKTETKTDTKTDASTTETKADTSNKDTKTDTTKTNTTDSTDTKNPTDQSIAERTEDLKKNDDASKTLRDSTASDIKKTNEASVTSSTPVVFPFAKIENGLVLSTIKRIETKDASVLAENTSIQLVGHYLIPLPDGYLVMVYDNGKGRISILDKETLKQTKTTTEQLSIYGDLIVVDQSLIYAVVAVDSSYKIAIYDTNLAVLNQSTILVDPATAIKIVDKKIYVQKNDGRMTILNASDLKLAN